MQEKKGISLIVLVITIIILAILATTAVLVLTDGGILEYANKSSFKSRASSYVEELSTYHARRLAANKQYDYTTVNASKGGLTEIKSIIKGITAEDEELYIIEAGKLKLVYSATEEEKEIVTKLGIEIWVPTEPGLYNDEDVLLASFDELVNDYGMDITKDYTSTNYNTQTSSPYYVLKNNTELQAGTRLIVADNVTSIGQYAFYNCKNLTKVTIGSNVKNIGTGAFNECNNLNNIHVSSLEEWNNTIVGRDNYKIVDANVTYGYRTKVERLVDECTETSEEGIVAYLKTNGISDSEIALYDINVEGNSVAVTAKETTLGSIITDGADYGKTINYTANGFSKWKVLHKKTVDGQDYVYLIASENIPGNILPTNIPNAITSGKNIYWEYRKTPTTQAVIERPKLWMANWSDYSTYDAERIASYFLSEEYFEKFKNETYGEMVVGAIGTPTAEMIVESWNQRSEAIGDDFRLTLTPGDYGYMTNSRYHAAFSRLDKLYGGSLKINDRTWLASPYGDNASQLFCLTNGAAFYCNSYIVTDLGLRPVVCLKSSIPASVGLTTDGTDIILK